MKLSRELAVYFLCLYIGNLLKQILPLPIPATVYGMILLFSALYSKVLKVENIEDTGDALIRYIGLFLMPVLATLVEDIRGLNAPLLKMGLILILSNILTLGITGYTVQALQRRIHHDR